MENSLISIIVPVYKVEKYLYKCLDSIINQSYTNLEIILVDDGSPDNCGRICDEYKKIDGRIKVIHKKNGGVSDARNVGVENANGEYISFVDSDDWISLWYVEKLYRLIYEYTVDIAIGNFKKVYEGCDDSVQLSKNEIFEFTNVKAIEQYFTKYYSQMVIPCGKLYNKVLFNDVRFPVGKVHEDEFTTHKLLYYSRKVVFTTEVIYYYFQSKNSITRSKYQFENTLQYINALEERLVFFKRENQNALWEKTFRRYFTTLISTYGCLIYKEKNVIVAEEIKKKVILLQNEILNNNFTPFFKFNYILFCLVPKTTAALSMIFKKIKKKMS